MVILLKLAVQYTKHQKSNVHLVLRHFQLYEELHMRNSLSHHTRQVQNLITLKTFSQWNKFQRDLFLPLPKTCHDSPVKRVELINPTNISRNTQWNCKIYTITQMDGDDAYILLINFYIWFLMQTENLAIKDS